MNRILLFIALLIMAGATILRAQSSTDSWSADCSNPVNPTRTNVFPIVRDNVGNPLLDKITRVWNNPWDFDGDYPYDLSFDAQPDSTNGSVFVFQTRRGCVEETSTTANLLSDSGRVYIQHLSSTGSILSELAVGDGTSRESLPRIVKTDNGQFAAVYKSSTPQGDILVANWYRINTLGGLVHTLGPINITSNRVTYGIAEFSLSRDLNDGILVAYTASNSSSSAYNKLVFAQWIDQYGTRQWGSGARQVNDPTGLQAVHCPIVHWTIFDGNSIDVAWGEFTVPPSYQYAGTYYSIRVQQYNFSHPIDSLYPNHGALLTKPVTNADVHVAGTSRFCMTTCRSDIGLVRVFAWKDSTVSRLVMNEYRFVSTPTSYWSSLHLVPAGLKDDQHPRVLAPYPCIRNNSIEDDPVLAYLSFEVCGNDFSGVVTRVSVNSPLTTVFSVMSACEARGERAEGGKLWISMSGQLGDKIYTDFPGQHLDYLCKLSGTGSLDTVIAQHRGPDGNGEADDGGAFEVTTLGTSQLNVINYEYGLSTRQKIYQAGDFRQDRSYYWGGQRGDFIGQNTRFVFQSYPTTGTFQAILSQPAVLESAPIEHAAHSATRGPINAVAFEKWTEDGSEIFLSYTLQGGSNSAIWNLVNVTTRPDTSKHYLQPKVAISSDAFGNPIAIVTYVRDMSYYGVLYTGMFYAIVDLTSGTVTFKDLTIDQVVDRHGYQNCDLLYDDVSAMLYAVYLKYPNSNYEIYCQRIYSGGGLAGVANNIAPLSTDIYEQVATCLNPDPSNSGVYVAWKQRLAKTISLKMLDHTGMHWISNIVNVSYLRNRYRPCLAAANNWVMMAWEDEQGLVPPIPPPYPSVYACTYDNTGNILPGWSAFGNLISSPTAPYTSMANYEAKEPSIVVTNGGSSGSCLIAFAEDGDPYFTNFSISSPRRIGVRSVNVNGTLGAQGNLAFNPAPTPANDITLSMFGYMERRPRLIKADGNDPFSQGILTPAVGRVLCAFETMPYLDATGRPFNALEVANHNDNQPGYFTSNVAARLLDYSGTSVSMNYSIARGPGAQELEGLHWTPDEGFWACINDYSHSDNHSADINVVDVNAEMRFVPDLSSFGWFVSGSPCHSTNSTGASSINGPFTIYNNSPMSLPLTTTFAVGGGGSFPPTPADFSTTLPSLLPGNSSDPNMITYTPAIFHGCDPFATLTETIVFGLTSGGVNPIYILGNGQAQKPSGPKTEESSSQLGIRMVPNPALEKSEAQVTGVAGTEYQVILANLLGQEVQSYRGILSTFDGSAQILIPTAQMPAGNYIVRIESAGRSASSMFTVQH